MIKVLAIDDEPLALRQLELYIGKIPFLELVGSCSSANSARKLIGNADAMFIDINMPDISGMEFVKELENPPMVVFTTAYSEYAVEGFKVNAIDYLLKPFSLEEFSKAAEKLRLRAEEKEAVRAMSEAAGHLVFRMDYKTVRVDFSDINYVESMSEYIKVHLLSQQAPLLVLYSMKRLAEQLPGSMFMRVHRSYIVSLARVESINANSLTLKDGTVLSVSETYRAALKDAFTRR